MKRIIITIVLMIVFSVIAVISGLAWLNNICVAKEWYGDVRKGKVYKIVRTEAEVEKADAQKIKAKVYHGPVKWLSWASVDMSTVSTFIPFFGFLLIAIAFGRILIWKVVSPKNGISEEFPFFIDYDRNMVILGLAGTLWGIIMIGYYPPKEVDMSVLMLCLHTALYSTLVAVLWVFFIARPSNRAIAWWVKRVTGLAIGSDVDVSVLFEELGSAASKTGKELKEGGNEIKAFNKQISDVKKTLQEIGVVLKKSEKKTGVDIFESFKKAYKRVADVLDSIDKGLQNQKQSQKQIIEQQQNLLQKNQELLNGYQQELIKQTAQRDEAEARAKTITQKNVALTSQLDQIRTGIKSLEKNF